MFNARLKIVTLNLLLATALSPHALAGGEAHMPDLLPANPQTGACYARVEVPAQYATSSKNVMVEEGYTGLEISPAQISSRQENIRVKDASTRYRVRQPRYTNVTEKVVLRPAYEKLSLTQPRFSTVIETVQTSQPRLIWKRGNPANLIAQGYKIHSTADDRRSGGHYGQSQQSIGSNTRECGRVCEVWCLVEEPAQSVQFNRKVLTDPGRIQRMAIPAKYQMINKQVVADPGGVEEVPVPAEYRTLTIENIVRPATAHNVNVPPKYADVATKTLTAPGRMNGARLSAPLELDISNSSINPAGNKLQS